METTYEVTQADDGRFQFKSYYVVWKLFFHTSTLFSSQVFKSYYVVWKLQDFRARQYARREFKSYYVVWKP